MTRELIEQLDIEHALVEELEHRPDLLPKQVVDLALAVTSEDVADYIRELTLAGTPIQPAAKVVTLKWRHGRRSVAALPLYERVLYRSVVNSISSDLVERVRAPEAFALFQAEPLKHEGTEYVVMTDLANYYGSIDLGRLSQELLRRTGQWAQVEWLHDFWAMTSDGFGGIPQMNSTSDWVGDTFADQLHRIMLRKGLAAWRHADDFRIACGSYGECVEALEILDEAARGLGLLVNERKTLTPRVGKYQEIVEGPQRRLAEINDQVQTDLTRFDPYDWTLVSPEEAEVLQESAIRVIDLWSPDPESQPGKSVDLVQVLPQTLIVLGVRSLPNALSKVPLLLRWEPQLTPVVARYLKLLAAKDPLEVLRVINECLTSLTLTKWQRLWLLHVVEDADPALNPSSHDLEEWMRKEVKDDLVPLRCQAAWSLARHGDLNLDEWEGLGGPSDRYAEPYAAAALPGVRELPGQTFQALHPVGPIDEAVRAWSASTRFAPPF